MRQFGVYPIQINYNLHTQLRYRYREGNLHDQGLYEEERKLSIQVATSSDSTIQKGLWNKELEAYENTIYDCLRKIDGNQVGRMVLGLLNKETTVWIIPKPEDEEKRCTCAQTRPLNYEIQKDGSVARGVGFGDTVIQFDPSLGDDTLFHELVHAYRYSRKKFRPLFIDVYSQRLSSSQIQSTEEFLAHQMENIYMSQANRKIEMDYTWGLELDKQAIYDFLVENAEMLQTLKYFLRHEYLAMLAAHSFPASYNPFRDYPTLEAAFLKDTTLPTLPELGAVLRN